MKDLEKFTKLPMNIQFFADGDGADSGADGGNEGGEPDAPQGPTTEELLAQIAAERAEKERLKAANDKLSKSEADMKRQLRAKQTTEEQEAEERKAAEEKRQQEYDNAIAELNKIKAEKAYTGTLADEKAITAMIEAVNDKDHNSIAQLINNAVKAAVKKAEADWLKTRPEPQAGVGAPNMTKEQILAIKDPLEQQKAIALNLSLFQ